MTHFKSPFSIGMLVSTVLLSSIIVYALYIMLVKLSQSSYTSPVFWGIILAFCCCVWALYYAFSNQIREVIVTESELIIKKMYGRIIIAKEDIVEVVPKKSLYGDMRLWGISGLFGYIGWFSNKQIGRYFALVSDGNSMLAIKTKKNECYVISCQNHLKLMELIK